MQSTKFLTWLIHDAILQKVDILRALIELNIHGFVESFFSTMGHENYIWQKSVKTYFSSILKSSCSGVTAGRSAVHLSDGLDRLRAVEALVEWLERYFPPAVIESNIKNVLLQVKRTALTKTCKKLLKEFESVSRILVMEHAARFNQLTRANISKISRKRFLVLLNWLQQYLS